MDTITDPSENNKNQTPECQNRIFQTKLNYFKL